MTVQNSVVSFQILRNKERFQGLRSLRLVIDGLVHGASLQGLPEGKELQRFASELLSKVPRKTGGPSVRLRRVCCQGDVTMEDLVPTNAISAIVVKSKMLTRNDNSSTATLAGDKFTVDFVFIPASGHNR